jgi:hypothetical protein
MALLINSAFVGAILSPSYIYILFMTSIDTLLFSSANRFMGSTVIFTIFDRLVGCTIFDR